MPIIMTAVLPGLDAAAYDQIIDAAGGSLRSAPGFRSHAAYDGDGGWTVVEVWESEADWRGYFDANIKSHLPAGTTQDIAEVHHVVLPELP